VKVTDFANYCLSWNLCFVNYSRKTYLWTPSTFKTALGWTLSLSRWFQWKLSYKSNIHFNIIILRKAR